MSRESSATGRSAAPPTAPGDGLRDGASRRRRAWRTAAVVALVVTSAAAALTYAWDSDLFWHLACAEWMLRNGRIMGHDIHSIDPEPRWVNVHWLFQVVIGILHRVGSFEALSAMKGVLAALTALAFAASLRKASPAWLLACGLAMLVVIAGRIRVRPESFTLLYLMLTIWLVEHVRRGGDARRLWWLVPIMLAWVNMHGLYVIGSAVTWAAVAGALADKFFGRGALSGNLLSRQALAAVLTATVVCLVNPWPVDTVAQPLLLWTRISGQQKYYTYVVSEFQPTWQVLRPHLGAAALGAATLVAMLLNSRRLPIGHALWVLPFLLLGALARRNVALLGPMCGYLLAWHGQELLDVIRSRRPALAKLGPPATAAAILMALVMTAGYVTERTFQRDKAPFRFGLGLLTEEYQLGLAKALRDLPAEGDVLVDNFGDAGPFLYYSSAGLPRPVRLMFMDGRLEAHSLERFIQQHRIHMEFQQVMSAERVALPPTVRFVIVRHDAPSALAAMSQTRRFRLAQVDHCGACFEDAQWSDRSGVRDPLPPGFLNLDEFDRPLRPDGRVEGMPWRSAPWYRRNTLSLNDRMGAIFLALGRHGRTDALGAAPPVRYRCSLMAVRYYAAALGEGIVPRAAATGNLAQAYQQRGYGTRFEPTPRAPVHVDLARALRLFGGMNLSNLKDPDVLKAAAEHLRTLLLAGQFDAGRQAVQEFMANLPEVSPEREYFDLRNTIQQQYEASSVAAMARTQGRPLAERVAIYASPPIGMIETAIAELRAAESLDEELRLTLGDLLLRTGRTDDARQAYAAVRLPEERRWQLDLRGILCDWVDGRLHQARDALERMAAETGQAAVRFYHVTLLEELGEYAPARSSLASAKTDDEALARLLEQIRERLAGLP